MWQGRTTMTTSTRSDMRWRWWNEKKYKNVNKKIRNNEKLFTMTVVKNAAAFHA